MIRRRVSAPVAMLAVIGIVHRTVALLRFRHALDNLVAQKPGYVTMQLLPIADLQAHLWRSLWLLQQSPPLDQLVMKAALLAPWPYGTACALCAFNAALTIATACLLYGIIARVAGSRILAVCLSCWFLLSTDTLVMEYALFGQVFYEMLGMFGATAVCALLVRMEGRTGSGATRLSAAAGLATALTALARASFSYLAVPLAAFVLLRWRWRAAAAFVLPVLLLQGGWALKNALVYGRVSLETSSWSGLNAERGLLWSGQRKQLCDEIVQGRLGAYPDWFIRMNADCPAPFSDISESYVPDGVKQRDAAIGASLSGKPPPWNTVAMALKASEYRTAILRFTAAHPALAWTRFSIGYGLFWQRIADFGALLFDPLYIVPSSRPLSAPSAYGFGDKQRVMLTIDAGRHPASRGTSFWTLSLAPLDALSLVTLHMVFPLLLGLGLWRRISGRPGILPPGAAAPAIIALYGMLMFSAFDVGENMRFRLAVEPEILALTAACLAASWRAATAPFLSRSSAASSRPGATGARPAAAGSAPRS